MTEIRIEIVERLPEPSVVLRFPLEADLFHPLGGRPEDMPLRPNVVIYASSLLRGYAPHRCWMDLQE